MQPEALAIQPDPSFLIEVESRLAGKISPCFHCNKCSGGCPIAFAMDILPNRLVRMVQLGMRDAVLRSSTIWFCVSCETCTTRCPNEVDIAVMMDTLRQIAIRSGIPPAEEEVAAFHSEFLSSVEKRGRVHEAEMLAKLKLRTGKKGGLLKDLSIGWEMLKRGKLKLTRDGVRQKSQIREIFEKSRYQLK